MTTFTVFASERRNWNIANGDETIATGFKNWTSARDEAVRLALVGDEATGEVGRVVVKKIDGTVRSDHKPRAPKAAPVVRTIEQIAADLAAEHGVDTDALAREAADDLAAVTDETLPRIEKRGGVLLVKID